MNNLVYFLGNSGWIYDCDSFLVLFTGWAVIMSFLGYCEFLSRKVKIPYEMTHLSYHLDLNFLN